MNNKNGIQLDNVIQATMKPDIEKIRQGVCQCLLDCNDDAYDTQCWDCPYYSEGITVAECKRNLRNDFMAMLKEQERIIKQYQKADGFLFAHGWKWEGR